MTEPEMSATKSLMTIKLSKMTFILSVLMLTACATSYDGPKPDFSLQGSEARAELNKFLLKEDVGYFSFETDPSNTFYTASSIRPLIESVSPDATKNIERSEKWARWQLYALGFGISGLIAGSLVDEESTKNALYTASALSSASSLGISFYAASISSNTPSLYNKDLRQKFNIGLGVSYNF